MRLVHLSDLHLGFRQFQRTTPTGINQREADVAQSFRIAVDKVIELRPDLVLVAGDVFHTVRPTNPAILHAFAQFSRLVRELPEAHVVMLAGNHDLPRATETLGILRLFAPLGIHVVDTESQRIPFPDLGLSVLAVPGPRIAEALLDPDPATAFNVLLLHGEVEGTIPAYAEHLDRAATTIPVAAVSEPGWSYVALGHYHVYAKVGPNAYYSGALDYTSSNVWGELEEQHAKKLRGKGIIERDLTTGKQTFHRLGPVREVLDLPRIEGRGMSAADLDAAIASAVAKAGGIDGKVARLVARNVPRHVTRELDHRALRELRRRSLHFHLDTRRPETMRRDASGAPGRRPSLAEMLRDSLRNRVLTSDLDRDTLVDLGLHYLREAEQVGAVRDTPTAVEEP